MRWPVFPSEISRSELLEFSNRVVGCGRRLLCALGSSNYYLFALTGGKRARLALRLPLEKRYRTAEWRVLWQIGRPDPYNDVLANDTPFQIHDLDGDGREEILIGYSLYAPDGRQLWSRDKQLRDHADGMVAGNFSGNPGAPLSAYACSSDDGYVMFDLQGNILKHLLLGHAQSPSIAKYRPELPGLQMMLTNFWRNPGIVTLLDHDGNILAQEEPIHSASPLLPVNWRGGGSTPRSAIPSTTSRITAPWCRCRAGGMCRNNGTRAGSFPSRKMTRTIGGEATQRWLHQRLPVLLNPEARAGRPCRLESLALPN